MKQPEDTKTKELPMDPFELAKMWRPEKAPPSEKKRGRGRPRVENPLSPAERARRYREKIKAEGRTRSSVMAFIRDDETVRALEARIEHYLQVGEPENAAILRRQLELKTYHAPVTKNAVTKKNDNETFFLKLQIKDLETRVADWHRFHEQRADDEQRLQRAFDQLRGDLAKSSDRINDLTGALDEVVQVASAGKRVPAHMLKGLMKLLADASRKTEKVTTTKNVLIFQP